MFEHPDDRNQFPQGVLVSSLKFQEEWPRRLNGEASEGTTGAYPDDQKLKEQ